MSAENTAQTIFMFPAEVFYEFILSIFGLTGLGYGFDIIFTVIIAMVFWVHIFRIIAAVVRRITGFEQVR